MVKRKKDDDDSYEEEDYEEDSDEEYEEEVVRAPRKERKLPSPPKPAKPPAPPAAPSQRRAFTPNKEEVVHLTSLVGKMKHKVNRSEDTKKSNHLGQRLISVKDSVSRLQKLIEENKRRGYHKIQQISTDFDQECTRRITIPSVSPPSLHAPALHNPYPYPSSPQMSPYPSTQPIFYSPHASIQTHYSSEDSSDGPSPFSSPMNRFSSPLPGNQGITTYVATQLGDIHVPKFSPLSSGPDTPSPHSPVVPLYTTITAYPPALPIPATAYPTPAPILTQMGTPSYLFGLEPAPYPVAQSFAEGLEDMEKSTRENVQKLENFLHEDW